MNDETQRQANCVTEPAATTGTEATPSAEHEVQALTVPNSRNPKTTRTVYRGNGGKFVKKLVREDRRLSGETHTRTVREFLATEEQEGEKSRKEKVLDSMYELVMTSADAKTATARVNAAKFLFESGYGKPGIGDEELKAMQRQPVRVVVVEKPTLMHTDVLNEKDQQLRKPCKPSFIEAEIVSTNPLSVEERK